jgi:nitroimidazol reductase NimA-like FMN-containing flavoprotein (pyridoxamine 5'-phosphate oxidase superfamily)
MLIDRMKPQECEELLANVGFGRLGCARDNQPYIVPIYFGHQPNQLFGFATFGRKIEWMRSNCLVCVQADEVLGPDNWASVIILGRYEELPDTAEYALRRRWAQSLLERRSLWWEAGYAASQVRSQPNAAAPIFYRIHIQEITGLRASPGERIVEKWKLKS